MALDSKAVPGPVKFTCAALAGVAGTLVCYPLDLLKLNMQVTGEGAAKRNQTTIQFASSIIKRDGIKGLYTGLTASMLRQFLYTGGRLGSFQIFTDYFIKDGSQPSVSIKALCGCGAGIIGGIVGLPPDVALTRMAVDKRLPVSQQRKYTHVFNAMSRINREEGVTTLFRGLGTTVFRAMVVNVSQLVSYVQFKQFLINRDIMRDGTLCHFLCSVGAAFVATVCVLPPDMAKTRIQNMKIEGGVREYKSMLDVWYKVVSKEGPLALWKGFTPLLIRNGPQTIVIFVVYEKMMYIYKQLAK